MTIIRSLEQSSEGPEARVVKRYHTSTALPGDYKGLLKEHGESMQTLLFQDGAGNTLSEEQMSAILPKIAESISKLENTEAQEILPGITQSITKLKNGGNLVITTMTRQIEDQEQEEHPVIHVDDLENSKLYLVNDSRGELYYVEDITEESEQSSHYSSHTNNNEYQTISKIKSNGNSGIRDSTAQEILSTMFGGNDVQEMREIDEEWNERSYDYEIPCRRSGYSKDAFKTPYMVEEPGGTLPRVKVASNENYQTSHQTAASGAMMNYYDSSMVQNYSQTLQGIYGGDDTHSVTTVSLPTADKGSRTIERYIIDGEIIEYPLAPPPIFLPPLPICIQTGSNYSLVKVDETPKPLNQPLRVRTPETPIYETMTTVKTSIEPLPPPRSKPKPKPKLTQTEVQESHIQFDEVQEEKCIRFDKVIKEEKPDVEESRYSYDESDVVIRGSYTENNADGNQMALVRRKGQSLSEYLLSRLKHVENVDIQQKIAVKHNSDDFHGNPRHLNADGLAYDGNFNTVHEKVDLFIKGNPRNHECGVANLRIEINIYFK
ncbi:hypothetical protein DPMN_132829 [Dreissena polymorpha]|uniref:Uncharacterized protein n=1 Tax=Dreissena polymorpha TaxID=45954 RepID=A0A9D4JAC5_DREPO|nr:hypothetical protein DPMN_132740 [Dreissena polymorpha]KAH3804542.1 hypothetical protein DPMN_132829 [Dreissena polymorpha]